MLKLTKRDGELDSVEHMPVSSYCQAWRVSRSSGRSQLEWQEIQSTGHGNDSKQWPWEVVQVRCQFAQNLKRSRYPSFRRYAWAEPQRAARIDVGHRFREDRQQITCDY